MANQETADIFRFAKRSSSATTGRLHPVIPALSRLLRQPFLLASWLIAIVLVVAAFAPGLVATHDPLFGEFDRLLPPGGEHIFGTDNFGRDLFARVVFGAQETVKAVLIAVVVGLLVGSGLGLIAGWYGRLIDDAIMRLVDVLLAVPTLMIALAIIAVLGVGTVNLAIAVGIGSVAAFARVMRGEVLKLRSADWVEAALFSGTPVWKLILFQILPGAFGPVAVLATLEAGWAILSISALSFLGFGAPAPAPEWGLLIATGRDYLGTAWWVAIIPGIAVALSVIALNTIARSISAEETGR